jgi:hypothetical protein
VARIMFCRVRCWAMGDEESGAGVLLGSCWRRHADPCGQEALDLSSGQAD